VQKINLKTQIEDIATEYPEAVGFLIRRGVRCIRCGEPVWGTLGELLEETGIEDPEALVDELNAYLQKQRENS
jgi:methionine synthase II (cobalamin-independent)